MILLVLYSCLLVFCSCLLAFYLCSQTVYSCSPWFTRVLHDFYAPPLLMFYLCSLLFYLFLLELNYLYSCLPMLTYVHLCSLMFWLKYYFNKDLWELSDVAGKKHWRKQLKTEQGLQELQAFGFCVVTVDYEHMKPRLKRKRTD